MLSSSSVAYCYDNADRLTSTTPVNPQAGAAPVSAASLALGTSLAYDSHGNTTVLADRAMTYDVSDQHVSTTVDGATVTYDRNISGAIVQRSSSADPFATVKYTAGAVLNAAGGIIQRTVSLPGGVSVTLTPTAVPTDPWVQAWFYPNLHGDVILQADAAGARQGTRSRFDPFGQPIDPLTGDIGTLDADNAIQDTTPGDADYAFVGGHGKLYEHAGSIATIEMGARQYAAALGRFLEVDPVEGGVSNAYDYPADPINMLDLSGMCMGSVNVPDWVCSGATLKQITRSASDSATYLRGRNSTPGSVLVQRGSTPRMGPASNGIPAPRDCSMVMCKKNDIALNVCLAVCIQVGFSLREDGAVYGSAGLGAGGKANVTLNMGGSTSTGNGTSHTIDYSCSAAALYGYYGGGSIGVADQWADGFTTPLTHDWASGFQVGAGAGCGAMLVASVPLWGE